MKETNCVLDFHFETEGDVGEYEKERLLKSMESILLTLMETNFYNIKSLKFSISNTLPQKRLRKKNRKHGLFVQYYNDVHQGFDIFFSWNGRREMNGNSRYLMNEFNKENGIIEYLKCSGYLIDTIDFELRTIEKFY
jgi:hypothetical protein